MQLGADPTKSRFILPDGMGGAPHTPIESVTAMPRQGHCHGQ